MVAEGRAWFLRKPGTLGRRQGTLGERLGIRIDAFAFDRDALAACADAGLLRVCESSHGLLHDLTELARGPGHPQAVRVVVTGSRRWWVGSFIESCRDRRWYVDPADRIAAEALLARLLRGHDCGALLRRASYAMGDAKLSVKPREDCDKLIATFEPTELAFLRLFLQERLADPGRQFIRPSQPVGIAPQHDADWDPWVRASADAIASADLSEMREPSLITFIG